MSDAKPTMTERIFSECEHCGNANWCCDGTSNELAELKERLAAAEYILLEMDASSPIGYSLCRLYNGTQLTEYSEAVFEDKPPTEPYLAKLWARYQKLQRFQ